MNVCRPRCQFVLAIMLALTTGLLPAPTHAADSLTCTGRFPNPITEIYTRSLVGSVRCV